MSEPFEYVSRARLEYRDGARHAWLGEVPERSSQVCVFARSWAGANGRIR